MTTAVASTVSGSVFKRAGARIADFWKTLGRDYKIVFTDLVKDSKAKPAKAGLYLSGLAGLTYMYQTNPSEEDTLDELREKRQQMVLIPNSVHNQNTDNELSYRSLLLCQNRLHYYNLWFFSLLVRSTHDDSVRSVSTQDGNLKDWPWTEFYKNILDVGMLGRWWRLEDKFRDFDINSQDIGQLPDAKKD